MALRGALTHRKTRRLARLLGYPVPCALGVMEALWHVTANHAPTGAIGALSNQDIADEMFWDGDADELIRALMEAELLDPHSEHRLVVHGWDEHADQGTRRKVQRNGQVMASTELRSVSNGLPQLDVTSYDETHARTPPVPVPEPEPCPEPESTLAADAPKTARRDRLPPDWEAAWDELTAAYPKRRGDLKLARGREKFRALLAAGEDAAAIVAGARTYAIHCRVTGKAGTEFVKQITSWLGDATWKEQLDTSEVNGNGRYRERTRSFEERKAELLGRPAGGGSGEPHGYGGDAGEPSPAYPPGPPGVGVGPRSGRPDG